MTDLRKLRKSIQHKLEDRARLQNSYRNLQDTHDRSVDNQRRLAGTLMSDYGRDVVPRMVEQVAGAIWQEALKQARLSLEDAYPLQPGCAATLVLTVPGFTIQHHVMDDTDREIRCYDNQRN